MRAGPRPRRRPAEEPSHVIRRERTALLRRVARIAAAVAVGAALLATGGPARAADTVDEIHYSFGGTPDVVVFDWRGGESTIYYGPGTRYGQQAAARAPAPTPPGGPRPLPEVAP